MKKIVVIFTLITTHANAQQLRLPDAINIALKNNLDIQLAKNNVEANTIFNNYGIAGGLPVVTATGNDNETVTNLNQKLSNGTTTVQSGVTSNTATANVTAGLLLYNGMRVVTTKSRLDQLQQQSQQLLNAQIQNTIAAVMVQYYEIVHQQGYMKTFDGSIAAAQQKLDIVQSRKAVGLANNADLFQSQLDLNALLQSKQSQQLVIDQAKTDLLLLLNVKADSVFMVSDTIISDETVALDAVMTSLDQNPVIVAADQQIKINQLIEKETGAQRYPSVRLSTGYNYSHSQSSAGFNLLTQNSGPFIGLNLSVPLYNGTIYKRQQQVAAIDTRNAIIQKESLEKQNISVAVKTFQSYQNALQQLKTEKQNYVLAQQLLDLVLQKFQLREATIVDVKLAQQSFEDAGFRLINLSFAAKSAEIELKRLMNKLDF